MSAEMAERSVGSGSARVALLGLKLFALFLMTLVNFPVFVPVIGVLILALIRPIEAIVIELRGLLWLCILFFALAMFSIKFWAFDVQFTGAESAAAFFNNLIAFSVLSCVYIYLKGYTQRHPEELIFLARGVLIAHLAIFFFQFGAYYGAGTYFDLFEMVTGTAARSGGILGDVSDLGAIRLTGLTAEPSNIASIFYLLTLVIVVGRRDQKFEWIVLPVVVAMFFTFSTAAAVLSVLLLGYSIYVVSDFRKIVILGLIIGVLVLVFAVVFQDEIALQIEKGIKTYGIRVQALVFIFERSGVPLYFGHGPFGIEEELTAIASGSSAAREISTVSDTGLAVFLMFQFGILGLVFYVLLLISAGRTLAVFFAVGLATLTKFEFDQIIFLVVIAFCASESRRVFREIELGEQPVGERSLT